MLEIDDSLFQCVAAGLGGVIVPEQLTILECCQDPDNLNIIYIRCVLNGIFEYIPYCSVSWDSITIDVTSLLVPGYKGIGVDNSPIDVGCGSGTFLLAYNIGSVVANFYSVPQINVTLKFVGQNSSLNLSQLELDSGVFISSNPTATTSLNKGLSPQPYKLYFDPNTNQLKVQYTNLGSTSCQCAINCVSPDIEDFNLTVCQNEIQEVSINANSIFGDPTNVSLTFLDLIGNTSNVDIHAMLNVKPAKPNVLAQNDPRHNNVNLLYVTINGVPIRADKVKTQILKYENNPDNFYVWKDWTSKSWNSLYDRNIIPGRTYGYAVRFKGEFGEVSFPSEWTTVEVT
jgi:hypothetical protein